MSDSSDSSCDEDDEAPLTEEDLQEMLWLHKHQKIAQQMYYIDKDVSLFVLFSVFVCFFFFLLENESDRKSTRLNSSHMSESRMPSSA